MCQALAERLIAAAGISDKERRHGYLSNVYAQVLSAEKPPTFILELGVWRGDSLRMWQACFPRARVRGVDWSPNEYAADLEVLHEDAYTEECASRFVDASIDLLVEDGMHSLQQQRAAFDLYWGKVAWGGLMVIEDIPSAAAAQELQSHVGGLPCELFDLSQRYASDSRALVIWK